MEKQKIGGLLQKEQDELLALPVEISKLKDRLAKLGANAGLLSDDKYLHKLLSKSKGRVHMLPNQTGGVGVIGLKSKRKLWRE